MDGAILTASQVIIEVVTWPFVVLLVIAAMRRRRSNPWFAIPAGGTILILAGTGVSIVPGLEPVSGATWFFAFPLLMATFPDGRFVPRWSVAPVVGWLGLTIAYSATGTAIADQPWWAPLAASSFLLVLLQLYRYRRRLTTEERESVRWVILACLVGFATYGVITVVGGGTVADDGPLSIAAANLAGTTFPLGFAIGLLRPRLAPVDDALRWCVVAIGSALILAPVFWGASSIAAFAGADAAASGWWGAAAVALVTVPIVRLAGRGANRLLFGRRRDPAAAVRELGSRLAGQAAPEAVTATIAAMVAEALGTDDVELTAAGLGDVTVGAPPPDAFVMPVSYRGETIGTIRVGPRRGESALTARDRAVLAQLVTHSAPALHGALAVSELIEARSRTVLAREEERKRLRRDLHDDLAPTLAGLGMSAAAIAQLARSGDPEASLVADELLVDIQTAIGQTRELAYGLRPPILDDQGLVAAIRDRLRPATMENPRITIHAPEDRMALPAAVELAALRIVQEAVSNVRRHASASACVITLEASASELTIEIADDGVGIPRSHRSGLGLASIRERADELGGASSVGRRSVGGTVVSVRLPLSEPERRVA
jgi:signal transduction histidine kinase